jgi:hypothetical protein
MDKRCSYTALRISNFFISALWLCIRAKLKRITKIVRYSQFSSALQVEFWNRIFHSFQAAMHLNYMNCSADTEEWIKQQFIQYYTLLQ